MAWEKRGGRSYYYRGVRIGGKTKKIYHGAGIVGNLAAGAEALRRAETAARKKELAAATASLEVALALNQEFDRTCDLIATAAMLAAGYHCPSRHPWRVWRHGRRVLAAETA